VPGHVQAMCRCQCVLLAFCVGDNLNHILSESTRFLYIFKELHSEGVAYKRSPQRNDISHGIIFAAMADHSVVHKVG
jgi:hypothetical protein